MKGVKYRTLIIFSHLHLTNCVPYICISNIYIHSTTHINGCQVSLAIQHVMFTCVKHGHRYPYASCVWCVCLCINKKICKQKLTYTYTYYTYIKYTYSVFMDIFPGEPGLAGTRMSPFCNLLELRMIGGGGDNHSYKTCKAQSSSQIITINIPTPNLLQARCPSCPPTNSIRALHVLYIVKNCNLCQREQGNLLQSAKH